METSLNIPVEESLQQIEIRPLVLADLQALEWDGEFRHFRRMYQQIYRNYCLGHVLMWVADLPGVDLLGQVFVQLFSSSHGVVPAKPMRLAKAYIYGFRIKPQYRNLGLGTRMMQVVEGDLWRRGYREVCLNVSQENLGALRLYERLGYHVVSAEPGRWSYIDDQGRQQEVHEPAWRMEKALRPPQA